MLLKIMVYFEVETGKMSLKKLSFLELEKERNTVTAKSTEKSYDMQLSNIVVPCNLFGKCSKTPSECPETANGTKPSFCQLEYISVNVLYLGI